MPKKWNLQDIRPVGESEREVERAAPVRPERSMNDMAPSRDIEHEREEDLPADYSPIDIVDGNAARIKRIVLSVVVAVLIIGAGFLVSYMMRGAEVTVYPKFKDINVQATFTGHKTAIAGELSYELLTLEATGERQVKATGQEQVSERAIGDILIYNAFSTSPQTLIKNTRFESPDGLIFRITESAIVPGMTKDAKGTVIPGVVTARAFADGTGEQYNIAPSRFTIPGLKGSEQYTTMYAESQVSMTGGFEGMKYIINEDELATSKQSLHLELRDILLKRVAEERPAGFIMYDSAITFAFDSLPATEYGDGLATIKERARLQVPIFKDLEFTKYLADNTIAGYEDEKVSMTDPYAITFAYTSATTTVSDISELSELEFTLKGQTRIVWEFDEQALKTSLAGLPKTALPSVLSGYTAIERAEAVVRPFWKREFPEDPTDISVIKQVGESQ